VEATAPRRVCATVVVDPAAASGIGREEGVTTVEERRGGRGCGHGVEEEVTVAGQEGGGGGWLGFGCNGNFI
jgi:hypothetical protein